MFGRKGEGVLELGRYSLTTTANRYRKIAGDRESHPRNPDGQLDLR